MGEKSSLCTMLLGKDSHGVANILANPFAKNDKKPSAPQAKLHQHFACKKTKINIIHFFCFLCWKLLGHCVLWLERLGWVHFQPQLEIIKCDLVQQLFERSMPPIPCLFYPSKWVLVACSVFMISQKNQIKQHGGNFRICFHLFQIQILHWFTNLGL